MTSSNDQEQLSFVKLLKICPACGGPLWARFYDHRTIIIPKRACQMRVPVYRCQKADCPLFKQSYRSERAGRVAPSYSKYSFQAICEVGNQSRFADRTPALQMLLAKNGLSIPLRTIPTLLKRFESLLLGRQLTDAKVVSALRSQRCAVLDIFSVAIMGTSHFLIAQELLSSFPLKMIRRERRSDPDDIRQLLADVLGKMPVPVVGFTSDDARRSKQVILHLLKNSGKGTDRYYQLSQRHPLDLAEVSACLANMIHQYHKYRSDGMIRRRPGQLRAAPVASAPDVPARRNRSIRPQISTRISSTTRPKPSILTITIGVICKRGLQCFAHGRRMLSQPIGEDSAWHFRRVVVPQATLRGSRGFYDLHNAPLHLCRPMRSVFLT